jgi:hypothetical protein
LLPLPERCRTLSFGPATQFSTAPPLSVTVKPPVAALLTVPRWKSTVCRPFLVSSTISPCVTLRASLRSTCSNAFARTAFGALELPGAFDVVALGPALFDVAASAIPAVATPATATPAAVQPISHFLVRALCRMVFSRSFAKVVGFAR